MIKLRISHFLDILIEAGIEADLHTIELASGAKMYTLVVEHYALPADTLEEIQTALYLIVAAVQKVAK